MKRLFCLLTALTVLLSGCFWNKTAQTPSTSKDDLSSSAAEPEQPPVKDKTVFTKNDKNNLVSAAGVEYALLAFEPALCYFGKTAFLGSVQGEHASAFEAQPGMFALKNDETQNVLIRHFPDNEWYAIYRKTSLPPLDYAVDNCVRLELIAGSTYYEDSAHVTCGNGITDPDEIAAFLLDIQAQKTADEAELYDGTPENAYLYGAICGFFEAEPNVAFPMEVWSFNDRAYSICIEDKEYVLPETWLKKFTVHGIAQ